MNNFSITGGMESCNIAFCLECIEHDSRRMFHEGRTSPRERPSLLRSTPIKIPISLGFHTGDDLFVRDLHNFLANHRQRRLRTRAWMRLVRQGATTKHSTPLPSLLIVLWKFHDILVRILAFYTLPLLRYRGMGNVHYRNRRKLSRLFDYIDSASPRVKRPTHTIQSFRAFTICSQTYIKR